MKKIVINTLKVIGIVIGLVVLFAFGFIMYLTAKEFKPSDVESVAIDTTEGAGSDLVAGSTISIMTWNLGYGALGDNADFFMDGGKGVQTATKERVDVNIAGIQGMITTNRPDIVFVQEIDRDSKRSYNQDELTRINGNLSVLQKDDNLLSEKLKDDIANMNDDSADINSVIAARSPGLTGYTDGYVSSFAYNYNCEYVPFPFPENIGKVESGIATLSKYSVTAAERHSLPCPFKWPVRVANLKRCILINRVPVKTADGADTGKELVLVNLHLEAYDSGEGKIQQTNMLKEILQKEYDKGNYVIAGGDFNQTFSSVDTSMYPELEGMWHCGKLEIDEFSSDWQFVADNTTPTCRSLDKAYQGADKENFQYYLIDGFIVSDNITIESCETQDYWFAASDHNPVLMNVTLE